MIHKSPHPGNLTQFERDQRAWVVSGDELRPNDVLIFLGRTYRIDALPDTDQCRLYADEAVRVIHTEGREFTWAIPSQTYRILPRVGEAPDRLPHLNYHAPGVDDITPGA